MDKDLKKDSNYVPNGWHRLSDGTLMRDSEHDGMMEKSLVTRYNEIFNGDTTKTQDIRITPFTPSPSQRDYEKQVIRRYFIQKANDRDAVIYEIDKNQKSKFKNNPTYNFVEIDWKITGDKEVKVIGEFEELISIEQMNRLSISSVSEVMPNLKLYLPNLHQFYKEDTTDSTLISSRKLSDNNSVNY